MGSSGTGVIDGCEPTTMCTLSTMTQSACYIVLRFILPNKFIAFELSFIPVLMAWAQYHVCAHVHICVHSESISPHAPHIQWQVLVKQ